MSEARLKQDIAELKNHIKALEHSKKVVCDYIEKLEEQLRTLREALKLVAGCGTCAKCARDARQALAKLEEMK